MSQHTDDDPEFVEVPEGQPAAGKKIPIRQLKADLAQAQADAEEGRKAQRELAFIRAGIDVNDKKAQYFVKGYDGEVTAEAIKAAATEAGFIAPPPPTTSKDEQDGHTRMLNASASSEPAPHQLTRADLRQMTPEQVVAAQEAGLLNEMQGIPT